MVFGCRGDIVNCESVLGKMGNLSVPSYSPHSMRAIHYVPLGPPVGCGCGASGTRPPGRSVGRSRWRLGIRFFLRQALFDGLGGHLVRESADCELVVTEDVAIVRGGEVGSEFADLGVDGLTDGSGEVIDFSLLLGW